MSRSRVFEARDMNPEAYKNTRRILPDRRYGETFEINHGEHRWAFKITIGRYPDGTIGEVFVSGGKSGSALEASVRDAAILLSFALQFGAPIETLAGAITREADGSPSTVIGRVLDELRGVENS